MSNKKPYCKVCHDAGKEYNNHWVKDLNGKTTCPTLLNTECRYCFKLGHTTKFCSLLTKNKKEKEKAERRVEAVSREFPRQKCELKKQSNGFAALEEDSDLEEEPLIDDHPILCLSVKPEVKTNCWAEIAARPKPHVEEKPIIKIPNTKPDTTPVIRKRWADWSDSDDEEDDY